MKCGKGGVQMDDEIRVIVGKVGLDGHERGAKVIARALRDDGMAVTYSGIRKTPEEIVRMVESQKAHVLLISILSGAHNTLIERVSTIMREKGISVVLMAGGIIPARDYEYLRSLGVSGIFTPGTRLEDIIKAIREELAPKKPQEPSV
jgi:methylmalonyl-CoA mutase, C-terminal domain